MKAGIVGQLKGPFQAGVDIFNGSLSNQRMKIGISIDEKDLLPYGKDKPETDDPDQKYYPTGFSFSISGVQIQMGRTGMYETDDVIQVSSLIFNDNTPQSVIVNYTTY